ncbi:MAG TPA: NAD-dependent epimerase/dehydratase family protein [Candidatus Elarobacter sp.]|nr:NAD-dependent epimerase/dehydratase family protein [Candidatus Elarobacter sp.]
MLVAGGAGFVGSSLALRLRARYPGARIVAADSLTRRGSEWNLPRLEQAGIAFVHADVRQPADLQFPHARFDLILDCAAEPAVLAAYERGAAPVIDANLRGTVNLLELARRDGADVVFLSTSRVYPIAALDAIVLDEQATRFAIAAQQTLPGVGPGGISEDFPLAGARSIYGATKLAAELLLTEYADMYGLRAIVDRCGVITGPWQLGKADQGVFALWMGRHYFKRPLAYVGHGGDGKQVRDLVAIDDLGDLILRQIEMIATLPPRVYNVGGGPASSLSLAETTEICREITGNRVEIERVTENRPADIRLYVSDNARVSADTGWSPRTAPRETLEDIFEWIRANERLVAPLWQ